MLLDRPARFLYRHHRDLYVPMRVLATEYRWIFRTGVGVVIAVIAWLIVS